jgi:MFS family permease
MPLEPTEAAPLPGARALSPPFVVGGPRALYVLWICSLLWMVSFMDRQVMSVVLEPARLSLGLHDSQAGWLGSAFLLGVAAFSIPVAHFADRHGRRNAIAGMAFVWSGATLASGLANDFSMLLVARFLTGAGEAGFASAGIALIGASYPEGVRARKLGFFNSFQVLGIGIGSVAGGALSLRWGWRAPLFAFALPGLILGFMALAMQDYPANQSKGQASDLFGSMRALFRVRTLRWFYAGQTAYIAFVFAVLGWAPTLLMRQFAVDEAVAGRFVASAGVLALPGALVGGVWSDRWQRRHPAGRLRFAACAALTAALGLTTAIPLTFWLAPGAPGSWSPWLVGGIAAFALFCAASAAVPPAVMAASQSVVGTEMKGLVWGVGLSLVLLLGGAWTPVLVGSVSDLLGGGAQGLATTLLAVNVFGVVAAICYLGAARAYPADAERASHASIG